jgi:hypothetical protein
MLDDRIRRRKEFIQACYPVQSEAYAEEVDDFVDKCAGFLCQIVSVERERGGLLRA